MATAEASLDQQILLPLGNVRLVYPPATWQCPDNIASFCIVGPFRAGTIRLQFNFRSDVPLILQITTDDPSPRILDRSPPTCRLEQNLLLRPGESVRGLRIEVIGPATQFHLSDVSCRPVSTAWALVDAVIAKVRQIDRYGGHWSAPGRGLLLLLQGRFHTFLTKLFKSGSGPTFDDDVQDFEQTYAAWRQQRLLRPASPRIDLTNEDTPLISVMVIAQSEEDGLLDATLASLGRQSYHKWEIVEVRSTNAPSDFDENEDVDVEAVNAALSRAQGEFVLFLNAGDEIADHACHALAQAIMADANLDMLTTDEDQIDDEGRHSNPHFKPGHAPEALLCQPNLGLCAVFRTSLVHEVGGFRAECAEVAVYDLALRCTARTTRIQHLADILLHRRQTKRQANAAEFSALTNAISNHLEETGRPGVVERTTQSPGHRVRFHIVGQPLISIIIPTAFANRTGRKNPLVYDCLRGIRAATTWVNYEIIVLSSGRDIAEVEVELAQYDVKIIAIPEPFNFASAINLGAEQAQGSQLLLLNDDTEVITPDWLECMLEYAQQTDIGAVGARLLFPHGRVQHTGLHILDGKPKHAFYGYPADHAGYQDSMTTPRNYLAVTGACLMTRHELFDEVGGLSVCFAMDCNDIDYCLRLVQKGKRIVCTPYAQLLHHEAITRRGMEMKSYALFKKRWANILRGDPYYNPNFNRLDANYKSLRMLDNGQ